MLAMTLVTLQTHKVGYVEKKFYKTCNNSVVFGLFLIIFFLVRGAIRSLFARQQSTALGTNLTLWLIACEQGYVINLLIMRYQ